MYLTSSPIVLSEFLKDPSHYRAGASVLFLGRVRENSHGKKVLTLEYEAYEPMAEDMLKGLVETCFQKGSLLEVRLLHRLGKVGLGEIAVAIEILSEHRSDAYSASRFLIEEIKRNVPIWKREYFEDGSYAWGNCIHEAVPSLGSV